MIYYMYGTYNKHNIAIILQVLVNKDIISSI